MVIDERNKRSCAKCFIVIEEEDADRITHLLPVGFLMESGNRDIVF